MDSCFESLNYIQQQEIEANSAILNTDLTPHVFLNGVTTHQLPNDDQWKQAYHNDLCCHLMISMLHNPSLINTKNINRIHYIYRSGMRSSTITYENNRLILHEPTVVSSKSINSSSFPLICANTYSTHSTPIL
jgi:hypothetical protein